MSVLAVVLGAMTAVYWFFSSGKAARFVTKTSYIVEKQIANVGFTLQHIVVDGRIRTKSDVIFKTLDLKKGQYIYDVNLQDILGRLERLPWIHSVRLERRLPDTLFVKLIEKHPVAFWQDNKKHYLVDTYGTLIGEFPLKDYPGYVVATGQGAAEKLPWLVQTVGRYENIYAKTTGAVFVSRRRWDLILKNTLTVKLAEDNIDEALGRLVELDKENRLSSPNIDTVDLRSPGRVYFYLSKEGLQRQKQGQRGKAT